MREEQKSRSARVKWSGRLRVSPGVFFETLHRRFGGTMHAPLHPCTLALLHFPGESLRLSLNCLPGLAIIWP